MNIYVDADACNVKEIIVKTAKQYNIPVFMFIDTSHILTDDYSSVITVDKANDSVDFAIANRIKKGDIAVTQDFGLAAMLLSKGAFVIHNTGFIFNETNIERLLFERHIAKEMRRNGKYVKNHLKKKNNDFSLFEKNLSDMCKKAQGSYGL